VGASRPETTRRPWRLWVLFGVCSLLSACSAPASLYATKPALELQWPPHPVVERIVWVKSIADYRDLGIATGGWKRVLELLTGTGKEQIVRPHGVLFDAGERLIVADPGAGVVHCMDVKAGRYHAIGREPGKRFVTPIGVTEDEEGLLYITDSGAATVYVYDLEQKTLKPFLRGSFLRPTGIAYSKFDGLIYIVDALGNQVVAVDRQGREKKRFGAFGDAQDQFNRPTDIAIDRLGRIYITDPLNYRIKVLSSKGELLRQFGSAGDQPGSLEKPKGLALDSEGHIYVADALMDLVQIFDDSGNLLLYFGGNGTADGKFWMPSGLFIDQNDFIFVADTYNRRIQVFRYQSATRAEKGGGGTGSAPAPSTR